MKYSSKICSSIFLLISVTAHAQVFRCDVNGKVIFSDAPCQSGQKGQLIQERKSSEEIYQDRLRALEAERKNAREILSRA